MNFVPTTITSKKITKRNYRQRCSEEEEDVSNDARAARASTRKQRLLEEEASEDSSQDSYESVDPESSVDE